MNKLLLFLVASKAQQISSLEDLLDGKKPQVDEGTLKLQQAVKGMNPEQTIEYFLDIIER